MQRCVLIGGGELDIQLCKYIKKEDYIIAADSGWISAEKQGVTANMVMGDFDSSHKPNLKGVSITVLPVEKDDTDTYYIARYIIENGFKDVLMCGMTGGDRIEHTFANIQTLKFLSENRVNATIINKYSTMIVICDGEIELPYMENHYFSVLSLDKTAIVNISNAKYNLKDYNMFNNYPIGLSNEFDTGNVSISAKQGSVLVVITKKAS